jgi:hypothetical protein
MTVHDLLLEVFCLIDDELQARPLGELRPRGSDPVLSDSEVITLALVGELLGFDADSRLFWFFREYHTAEFPLLARVHRTTFVRQAANLHKLKETLHLRLAERLNAGGSLWLIDSMPVPVCRFGRGGYVKSFQGDAAFGYDCVQKQAYYGFRLHLRTDLRGVILSFVLAPANVHDLDAVLALDPPAGSIGIGDRNYNSPGLRHELGRRGVQLVVPPRLRRKDPDPEGSRRLGRLRWKVEGVNGQLTGRFRVKRVRARDLWHLAHRMIRKVLSHTVAVWLTLSAGYPPLHFAALFDD